MRLSCTDVNKISIHSKMIPDMLINLRVDECGSGRTHHNYLIKSFDSIEKCC